MEQGATAGFTRELTVDGRIDDLLDAHVRVGLWIRWGAC